MAEGQTLERRGKDRRDDDGRTLDREGAHGVVGRLEDGRLVMGIMFERESRLRRLMIDEVPMDHGGSVVRIVEMLGRQHPQRQDGSGDARRDDDPEGTGAQQEPSP